MSEIKELKISELHSSDSNPRRHIDAVELKELQESISQHGVLQPILVRKNSGGYEIIAGERRFQAAKKAGLKTMPAKIIEADDRTAAALRLIGNLQRKDLNPIEEAQAYKKLADEFNYSIEEIAKSAAKSMAYVTQRFKLIDLPSPAAKAIQEGKISAAIGLLIARIPDPKLRDQASKEIIKPRWGDDGPLNYRKAKELIAEEFMTELSRAPFKIDDPNLVPAAGSCLTCPKRTGTQANLFADVTTDSCTDNACFAAKKKAHFDRVFAEAKEKGFEIITGREAEAAESYGTKYVNLNDRNYEDPKSRTWRALLGKEMPPITVAYQKARYRNDQDKVIEYIQKSSAIAVLKKKYDWASGISSRSSNKSSADKAREKKLRRQQKAAQIAIGKIVEQVEKIGFKNSIATIVDSCLNRYGGDVARRIVKRRELKAPVRYGHPDNTEAVKKLGKDATTDKLSGLLIEIIAQWNIPQNYSAGYGDHLKKLAKAYNVNLTAIEKKTESEKPKRKSVSA